MRVGRVGLALLLVAAGSSAIACGSEEGRNQVRGGQNGTGSGNGNGNGNGNGTGGIIDIGGNDGGTGQNGGCNEFQVNFGQEIPNVVLLVDRSGSMWDNKVGQNTFWDILKPAILTVVQEFESEVKFSFTAYTAPEQSGPARSATCPTYVDSEPPQLNNGASIQSAYDLASTKIDRSETPTIYAIEDAVELLLGLGADSGPKYIVLVTDGQPDFCDSQTGDCALLETIGVLQDAYNKGIGTIVVGLVSDSGGDSVTLARNLQLFANAGAGVEVPNPNPPQNTYDWCWSQIYGKPTANYPPTWGTPTEDAQLHLPEQDTASLTAAIGGVIRGVKSCVYQLDGQVKINPDSADRGKIYIKKGDAEIEVTFGEGWKLGADSTSVQLLGDSCDELKAIDTTGIRFDFPCDVFVR